MYRLNAFDSIPLWLLTVVSVVSVIGAVEAGFRFGIRRSLTNEHEADAPVGVIVGATLGLLAFMLAFTFSLAASRFEARRQLVLDEANAIGTAYLRAGMLAEPHRSEIRKQLHEYVAMLVDTIQRSNFNEVLERSNEFHERLWTQAEAATKVDRSPIATSFIIALNEVIDLHASRIQAGLRSRIPVAIWIALALITVISMLAMGFQMGLTSKRRTIAAFALVITFSTVILLIVDLDRPGQGMLEVSQQATIDLLESMKEPH